MADSTLADITREWLIRPAPNVRVDMTMYINPDKDVDKDKVREKIQNLRRSMPMASINHTAWSSLVYRPATVSIETKRQSGAMEKGLLQSGVWQASQWNLLSHLAGDAINLLEFIPGIVIEGDDWKFVATTHSRSLTVSYSVCLHHCINTDENT